MLYQKLILLIIVVIPTLIIFIFLFELFNKKFQLTKKRTLNRFIVLIFVLLFTSLNIYYFNRIWVTPIKNNGIEFNSERKKLGIPKIDSDWIHLRRSNSLFNTYWYRCYPYDSNDGHFKKVIENGFFGLQNETDFYYTKNDKNIYVWSIYDFDNKSFEYFYFDRSVNKPIFINSKGDFRFYTDENGNNGVIKINKTEFEKYITE